MVLPKSIEVEDIREHKCSFIVGKKLRVTLAQLRAQEEHPTWYPKGEGTRMTLVRPAFSTKRVPSPSLGVSDNECQ